MQRGRWEQMEERNRSEKTKQRGQEEEWKNQLIFYKHNIYTTIIKIELMAMAMITKSTEGPGRKT
jgi:hypothetical protein